MQRIVIAAIAALSLGPAMAQERFTDSDFADYTPDPANGRVVYHASGCASCHAIDGSDDILAGGMEFAARFATLYAPNITPHHSAGIGNWSRADFLNAVLRGVSPDGRAYYGAVFPYPSYSRMRPEDALDLQAFMRTLPESDMRSRPHQSNFLSDVLLGFYAEPRPALSPPADAQLARGQYLVEALGHCAECHSGRSGVLAHRLDPERAFAGDRGILGETAGAINAAALTRDGLSPDNFVNGVLVRGERLNGLPMTSTTMRRISRSTAQLSHDDRVAIYAYLTGAPIDPQTVPQPATGTGGGGGQGTEVTPGGGSVTPDPATVIADETGAGDLLRLIAARCDAPAAAPAVTLPATAAAAPGRVDPALESAADAVLQRHCRDCHDRGRTYERTFLTGNLSELARDRGAVVPGDHRASLLYQTIAMNRMPTRGLPRLTQDELRALTDWIDALAPAAAAPVAAAPEPAPTAPSVELPRYIGGSFLEQTVAALADLGAASDFDRPFIRYLSFANIPLPDIDCALEGPLRNPVHYMHAALNKIINSVSRAPVLRRVDPVPGTGGSLVRIDLRDFGWTPEDWAALTTAAYTQGAAEAGYTPDAWARQAPVYPYAVDPASEATLSVVAGHTRAQVPILNADWFARHASEAPHYDVLLRLPDRIQVLEARMGIDVNQAIMSLRMIRAGFLAQNSGVSDHNRMLERFDLPNGGYYWKSYDFAGDAGRQSLVLYPDGPPDLARTPSGTLSFEHDGGEMIFTLPNGMQGYYLSEADGRRLSVGPTEIVSFRDRPVGMGVEIVNARSCFTCHDNGIIPKQDQIRDFITSSARFDQMQREALLRMYPTQEVLNGYYNRDIEAFVSALDRIGATQTSVAGVQISLTAPDGRGELVTWLADHRFTAIDEAGLARMFHLEPGDLRTRMRQMGDPVLQQVMQDWMSRFEMGLPLRLDEVDPLWPELLPRLTSLRPLPYSAAPVAPAPAPAASYDIAAATAIGQTLEQAEQPWQPPVGLPAYVAPPAPEGPALQLRLHVARQQVRVNELLNFQVQANRACELQIFYVNANRSVLVLSEQATGPALLAAGEWRQIPPADSGRQLRFDAPGSGEVLAAYCREPGSGERPMTADEVVAAARAQFQPLTRSLVEEAEVRAERSSGRTAIATIRFDVIP